MSKSTDPGGMYFAIESGLIMKTGLMLWIALPASLMSRRTGKWRDFFWNSRRSTRSWPPP